MTKTSKKETLADTALAKYVSQKSNAEYFIYEIQDLLELITSSIKELIIEGKQVRIKDFGTFKLKKNSPRVVSTKPMKGKVLVSEESYTLKFNPSVLMQNRIKESVKERLAKNE